QNPLCSDCIQRPDCQAFEHGWVSDLPVKQKALVRRTRWFNYFIIRQDEQVYIQQRNGKDIWTNLFEFILYESDGALLSDTIGLEDYVDGLIGHKGFSIKEVSKPYRQLLTHQTIIGQFITIQLTRPPRKPASSLLVLKDVLKTYPFPRMINAYMQDSKTVD
ncbi:MAG: NUDIX domain-containing protein, partial [Chitinophagaceae bacterium]